jgi:hypothetical protein
LDENGGMGEWVKGRMGEEENGGRGEIIRLKR